ncbi:MAG: hypothetical protein ABI758_06720 [Candidatus Woesebacteria bacterium]
MKKFNYQDKLQEIIARRELVEVNLRADTDHAVAFIMDANDEYLTFARISNDASLIGVVICLTSDLESIQVETTFIGELAKFIDAESLHNDALKVLEHVKKFSFEGVVSSCVDSEMVIEITTSDNQNFSGRIIALDHQAMVIDEYYPQDHGRFARTYLNPSIISRITMGGTWQKIISRSISDKNL